MDFYIGWSLPEEETNQFQEPIYQQLQLIYDEIGKKFSIEEILWHNICPECDKSCDKREIKNQGLLLFFLCKRDFFKLITDIIAIYLFIYLSIIYLPCQLYMFCVFCFFVFCDMYDVHWRSYINK